MLLVALHAAEPKVTRSTPRIKCHQVRRAHARRGDVVVCFTDRQIALLQNFFNRPGDAQWSSQTPNVTGLGQFSHGMTFKMECACLRRRNVS
jgi:hypothetical protein